MMEKYIKKMPLLFALGFGMLVGMFFLYQKKTITQVFPYLLFAVTIFYVIGHSLKATVADIYEEFFQEKNYTTNIGKVAGNTQNIANNANGNTKSEAKLDLQIGSSPDEFEELSSHMKKK